MKKLLLYAGAVIVALASCTKDPVPSDGPREKGEKVIYEFGAAVPDGFSRYDMEKGALAQVNPEEVLLRYVMEVYDPSGNTFGRYIRYVDFTEKAGTNFRVQLMADKYKIAVWADFIPKALFPEAEPSPIGNGYIDPKREQGELQGYFWGSQTSLAEIDAKDDYFDDKSEWFTMGGRRMLRDAYSGTTSIDLLNNTNTSGVMALKRPLGRYAVYGKNMDADRLAAAGLEVPDSVTVTYPVGTVVMQYNVVDGKVLPVYNESELVFGHNLDSNHPVEDDGSVGNAKYPDLQLITFDYLLPTYKNEDSYNDVLSTLTIKYFSKGTEIADLETVVPEFRVEANKQKRFVANPFGDDHQYVAVVKDADGNVIKPKAGELMDAATALAEAYAMVSEGGTIKLYAGEFKTDGLTIEKGITIEGIEGKTVIYAENPVAQTTLGGSYYGKNPILFVKGDDTSMEVAVKGVKFTIRNSPFPANVDGVTVDDKATLALENVVFDGIGNTPFKPNGSQYGRCVTVLGESVLNAEGCTFKNYNKNAVDVFAGGTANLSNCTVVGNKYNAQKVYDDTAGTPEEKLEAAYAGHTTQNGFVFRTGAAGSVTGCSFSDITFNLDKGLRKEKYDQSRAVYLYEPDETTQVAGEEDETNTYANCELNWSAWNYMPPLDDATLSAIMINGEPIADFDPGMTTEPINVNVASNVASALVTAESTDFYAKVEIDPAVATDLEVNVPVTFTINTSSEQFVVDGSGQQLTYTVIVTRLPSTDATLKELKYNGEMVPEFTPEELVYNLEVPFSVDKMTITAEKNYATASQTIDPEGEVDLNVGEMKTFNVDVTAEDGTTTNRYTVNVTRLPDTDATLSALQYNDGTEDKAIDNFDPTVYEYTLTVPSEVGSIEIKAAATSSVAQTAVSPAGMTQLNAGVETPFTVEVTAQDGVAKQTYTIKVTRELSDNANLASLGVSGLEFTEAFDKNKLAYTVLVPASQETINIEATAESTYDGVVVAIDPANTPLVPGVPVTYNIVVTAQDQVTVKTYKITALRASDNTKLGNLMVNGVSVAGFDPEVTTGYTVYLPNATENATVSAIAADADPRVQIAVSPAGSVSIAPGASENFTVTVTAADGVAEASYQVQVYRLAANWLSDLKVNGQTIAGFSPASFIYTNSKFDGETAEIKATAAVSSATVDIAPVGSVDLEPGAPQTFRITVTPAEGVDLTPQEYIVNLTRPVE